MPYRTHLQATTNPDKISTLLPCVPFFTISRDPQVTSSHYLEKRVSPTKYIRKNKIKVWDTTSPLSPLPPSLPSSPPPYARPRYEPQTPCAIVKRNDQGQTHTPTQKKKKVKTTHRTARHCYCTSSPSIPVPCVSCVCLTLWRGDNAVQPKKNTTAKKKKHATRTRRVCVRRLEANK